MATGSDDRAVFAKLEAIKDIRDKTVQLENVKTRLIFEVESHDREEKCITEYKQEMHLLLQEKMSHVEELTQIHSDINAMEGVINQADESRTRSLNSAVRLHQEYLSLKNEIDQLRRDTLGLERLPELYEEQGTRITQDRLSQLGLSSKMQTIPKPAEWNRPLLPPNLAQPLPTPSSLCLVMNRTSMAPIPHAGQPMSSFRQSPPMKSCLSCHQEIHRNAPICPLCKAKSRSQHPKKSRKK